MFVLSRARIRVAPFIGKFCKRHASSNVAAFVAASPQPRKGRLAVAEEKEPDLDPLPGRATSSKATTIKITWPSGEKRPISTRWLRDHCHCTECTNQDTMQRAFDTFSTMEELPMSVTEDNESLRIKWSPNHVSLYSWEWLKAHEEDKPIRLKRNLWGSEIMESPPSVHYDAIMASNDGVGEWTSKTLEYGFCFVENCPVSPSATETLINRIAFIRPTHYGGFYDFTSDLTMKDTAYTSLALPAHTDTTYFTDPAGLQMFHLLSHTEGTGGSSLLVDGFSCAAQLKAKNKQAYDILSSVPVPSHASGNEGIVITPSQNFPVLNHDPNYRDSHGNQELLQIRWNNDDRATMPMEMANGIRYDDWLEAAALWNSIVKDAKNEYWEQLRPGRPLIFDNRRVMHGRSAFTGKRRMCGAYINGDDFMSRHRTTNFSRDEVLKRII